MIPVCRGGTSRKSAGLGRDLQVEGDLVVSVGVRRGRVMVEVGDSVPTAHIHPNAGSSSGQWERLKCKK